MVTYIRAQQVEVKDIDEALVITTGRNMYRQDWRVPVRVIVDNRPVIQCMIKVLPEWGFVSRKEFSPGFLIC